VRRHRQRRKRDSASDIDVTAFLSLLVILVPFLLISAVFSRITILELQPATDQSRRPSPHDPLQLQLVVREAGIEVSYLGLEEPLRFPRTENGSELEALARLMDELKRSHPRSTQAALLLEPQISYDTLVQVMDSVRLKRQLLGETLQTRALFPAISLAETPVIEHHKRGSR
jgi:biopolymer transport protein ExbD